LQALSDLVGETRSGFDTAGKLGPPLSHGSSIMIHEATQSCTKDRSKLCVASWIIIFLE